MIVRLVSLKIHPDKVEEFKQFFETIYDRIREAQGCLSLRVVADLEGLGEFFTVSEWESPAALEAYKDSAFFRETWPRVKTFLRDRPWAQSFHVLLDEKRKALTGRDGKPDYAPG